MFINSYYMTILVISMKSAFHFACQCFNWHISITIKLSLELSDDGCNNY